MNIYHEDDFDFLNDPDIARDSYIQMKCTNCGHEEDMPEFVYGEEADYLLDIGDTTPPCFQCPKCHKDTLYRKNK